MPCSFCLSPLPLSITVTVAPTSISASAAAKPATPKPTTQALILVQSLCLLCLDQSIMPLPNLRKTKPILRQQVLRELPKSEPQFEFLASPSFQNDDEVVPF